MRTYNAKAEEVKHGWYLVDAADKTLGRLATEVARRLRGKHKPEFTPYVDTGDYIVVINAAKVRITGAKNTEKKYHRYSGYQSGLSTLNFEDLAEKAPNRIIEFAVKGMLPKGPLGRQIFKKLKVYGGAEHPHKAQQPQVLKIRE